MRKTNRIPAFTIFEMIVAMIISSIVISFIYISMNLMNRQWLTYRLKSEKLNEFLLVKKTIETDVERAESVFYIDSTKQLILTNHSNPSIEYQFGISRLLRSSVNSIDTFILSTVISNILVVSDKKKLVRSFTVNVSIEGQNVPTVFSKPFTAKELMNVKNDE